MARLFIGQKEIQFVNDLTKEWVKDVVGQVIHYFPISTISSNLVGEESRSTILAASLAAAKGGQALTISGAGQISLSLDSSSPVTSSKWLEKAWATPPFPKRPLFSRIVTGYQPISGRRHLRTWTGPQRARARS
jgi:hypothetical protein